MPAALAAMPLAPAAPYAGEAAAAEREVAPAPGIRSIDADALAAVVDVSDTAVADAVYFGGTARSPAPGDQALLAVFGALLTWLPPSVRLAPRSGAFTVRDPDIDADADARAPGIRNMLHYLTQAWRCPPEIERRHPGFAADAWRLVGDLAAALGGDLPAVFDELTALSAAWDTADHLAAHLRERALSAAIIAACDRRAPAPLLARDVADAGWQWNRLLHYWGRGFFGDEPAALLDTLAGLLARRITADHLFYLDAPEQNALPRRYLRRLRYEALLPRAHVDAMTAAVGRYLPSLEVA
jgi:hypothetical protein